MTSFIFADNVNTSLAAALSSSATSLTLASSANLPTSIPAGMALVITLNDQATRQNFEIIYATAISGTTLSGLLRGQEGTSAQNWLVGDYAWNGVTAGQMRSVGSGRLLGITVLTAASGNFTPNPAATLTYVKGCSGGGSGGGAVATGSGQVCIGSGGNAGAYCEFSIVGAISGPVAYTCGQGGVGVAGATGNAGGNSTFGTYATCPGGLGGLVSPAAAPPFFETGNANGNAPTLSGATAVLLLPSPSGTAGLAFSLTSISGGRGNNNPLGVAPSAGYGTGGNGAANFASSPAQAGTNGTNGAWIVYEYA